MIPAISVSISVFCCDYFYYESSYVYNSSLYQDPEDANRMQLQAIKKKYLIYQEKIKKDYDKYQVKKDSIEEEKIFTEEIAKDISKNWDFNNSVK